MRLLIVDDEKLIRDVIKTYAETENYETVEAENGLEALEIEKNQNNIKRVECETKYYNDMYYKYEKGAVSYLDTLKYKENLLSLKKEEIQSKTDVIIASLSLYKSVGGQL